MVDVTPTMLVSFRSVKFLRDLLSLTDQERAHLTPLVLMWASVCIHEHGAYLLNHSYWNNDKRLVLMIFSVEDIIITSQSRLR